MRRRILVLFAVVMLAGACTDEPSDTSTIPSPPARNQIPQIGTEAEIEIYAAVIRRLVTKDHTFGRAPTLFDYVYVVNGSLKDAGDPLGDHFGPASEPFPSEVVDGIEERLEDLPPVRFVRDGNGIRLGKQGIGGVKNDGVIISLGPIERKNGKVYVSNGLWCGGTCGQWLTYVLREAQGRWKITGTTGSYAIS